MTGFVVLLVLAGCSGPPGGEPDIDEILPGGVVSGVAPSALPPESVPSSNYRAEIADVTKDPGGNCQATLLFSDAQARKFAVEVTRRGDSQLLTREELVDADGKQWLTFEHAGALRDLNIRLYELPEGVLVDEW